MVPLDKLAQIAERFEYLEAQLNAGAAENIACKARAVKALRSIATKDVGNAYILVSRSDQLIAPVLRGKVSKMLLIFIDKRDFLSDKLVIRLGIDNTIDGQALIGLEALHGPDRFLTINAIDSDGIAIFAQLLLDEQDLRPLITILISSCGDCHNRKNHRCNCNFT